MRLIRLMVLLLVTTGLTGCGTFHTVQYGSTSDIDKLLQSNPAALTERTSNGSTPLHVATLAGRTNIITHLLTKGADINARDDDGNTPLHLAAAMQRVQSFRLAIGNSADGIYTDIWETGEDAASVLASAGADRNAVNRQGRTPLDVALLMKHYNVAARICSASGEPDIDGMWALLKPQTNDMAKRLQGSWSWGFQTQVYNSDGTGVSQPLWAGGPPPVLLGICHKFQWSIDGDILHERRTSRADYCRHGPESEYRIGFLDDTLIMTYMPKRFITVWTRKAR